MDRLFLRTALIAVILIVCTVQFSESESKIRERRDVSAAGKSKTDLADLADKRNVKYFIKKEHTIVKRGLRYRKRRCRYGRRRLRRVYHRRRFRRRRFRRIYRRRRFRVRRVRKGRFRLRCRRLRRRCRKRVRVRIPRPKPFPPSPPARPLPLPPPPPPPPKPLPLPYVPVPPIPPPPVAHGCFKPCGFHAHCVHGACICDLHCTGDPYLGCHFMKKK